MGYVESSGVYVCGFNKSQLIRSRPDLTEASIVGTFQVSKHACYQQHGASVTVHNTPRPEQDCLGSNLT